jgi:hypothetical protein
MNAIYTNPVNQHDCKHRGRLPQPCTCGAEWHWCEHCHDDPPAGHRCPCCATTRIPR